MKVILAVLGVALALPVLLVLAVALGPAALVIGFIVACAVPVLLLVDLGTSRHGR